MMMEGFSLGPRASNGSAANSVPKEVDRRWSAHERAQRVAHDAGLRGLLSDEIRRSGFLTSAGHRAVYEEFLHSDAVDREMLRARDRKPEGRLRRMMSEHSSRRRNSSTSSLFRSSSSLFSSFLSDASFDHRSIENEVADEEVADHAYRGGNIAPRRRRPSQHEAADAYSFRNIAPRRPSQHEFEVVYAPSTELPEDEFSSEADDTDDESVVHDAATAAASYAVMAEKEDERARRAERLEAMRLAYASRVFQLLKGQEDDDRSVSSDQSDEDSDADESGWIPWPEQRD